MIPDLVIKINGEIVNIPGMTSLIGAGIVYLLIGIVIGRRAFSAKVKKRGPRINPDDLFVGGLMFLGTTALWPVLRLGKLLALKVAYPIACLLAKVFVDKEARRNIHDNM